MQHRFIRNTLGVFATVVLTFTLFFTLACAELSVNGCTANDSLVDRNITEKECIEYTGPVMEQKEFGGVCIEADSEEFRTIGFNYGDSCNITFSNGYALEEVPFYNGYYARSNFPAIVDYQGEPHVIIAFCSGDLMWDVAGCKEGDTVTITLNERAKYLANQNAMNMVYSDERKDFDSDEMFANFRVMQGGCLKDEVLYRGASPVNNVHNRANTVDALLEANEVQFVLDLADNAERIENYQSQKGFQSDYFMMLYNEGKVAAVGLNVAFKTEAYAQKLVAGLNRMSSAESPYYIHCTEGKDRTGFVCILLEAVGGCSYDEIRDDYMYTYYNYFRITEKGNPETYRAIEENRLGDMLFFLTGTDNVDDIKKANLEQAAKNYLLSGGMTETEYAALKNSISR